MQNKNFGRNTKYALVVILAYLMIIVACSEKTSSESSQEQSKGAVVNTLKTDTADAEMPAVTTDSEIGENAPKKTKERSVTEFPKVPPQPSQEPVTTSLAPLDIKLPKPMFVGTPQNMRVAKLEKPLGKPRPPFLAPAGTKNVAFKKPTTSTDDAPIIGEIAMITDGDKEAGDGSYVELGPFLQHITIDLGSKHNIYAILFWHFHKQPRVYFDVIVRVADDAGFTKNVHTLFNNDHDNSAGFGAGRDLHYVETSEGKLIDAKGVQARYVRLYSSSNTNNDLNHYIEVEVYGKPLSAL